jgi:hypothetical protein
VSNAAVFRSSVGRTDERTDHGASEQENGGADRPAPADGLPAARHGVHALGRLLDPGLLSGIHLALAVNVVVTVTAVAFIWTGLRPRSSATSDSGSSGDSGETSADELAVV